MMGHDAMVGLSSPRTAGGLTISTCNPAGMGMVHPCSTEKEIMEDVLPYHSCCYSWVEGMWHIVNATVRASVSPVCPVAPKT